MQRIDLGCDRGKEKELTFTRLITTALVAMTVGPSCSQNHRQPATLDPKKVASIVVGSSSRADVFAILGRPSRTERSAQGEAWIYEVKEAHADRRNLVGGVAAASGLVGAVVPYAGLVGSALSLADAATGGGANSEDDTARLAVQLADNGVVRDCVYSSTALPTLTSTSAPAAPVMVDCRRSTRSPEGAHRSPLG